ncbi:uncharacterized protein A4U43_C06F8520 [Asparagus officinalis]|uniref:Uncharacterized protein n=1 Tax=Asparagus officinalis TaxID=4686 RepID=A0A5P1EL23_ASPOF|nr:uncharacterized protein A4U43_C06F8520 [Asparagus officinalis]
MKIRESNVELTSVTIIRLLDFLKGAPSNRKRRAWSESDEEDDQPSEPNPNSSSGRDRENSSGSDEEARGAATLERLSEALGLNRLSGWAGGRGTAASGRGGRGGFQGEATAD